MKYSLFAICKKIVIEIMKLTGRALYWWPQRFRLVRRIIFDSAPAGSFIYAGFGKEKYLVSAGDKAISREIFIRESFDLQKLDLAISLLSHGTRPTTLVDVGANVGCICIPAIKSSIFSRAIAIEPEPRNFNLLCANIAVNGLTSQISVHNFALSDTPSRLQFELSEDNFGDHRVRLSTETGIFKEQRRHVIDVEAKTFDSAFGDLDLREVLLWMDTQGYEGPILAGAEKALATHVPLVLEFWPYGMQRAGSYDKMKQALLNAGYKSFYELVGTSPEKLPLTAANLDELYNRLGPNGRFSDIMVV
jgi:FkbM family methyltransferase